jgi:NitT/TauT family transport system ATP-binding protein
MLKFINTYFKYDDNIIFHNFSYQFTSKKIHALIGPSGCGKTTLLKLTAGILKPEKGKISTTNQKVSYIFQDVRLIEQLTIFKNLDFILKNIYPNKEERKAIIKLGLKDVGMEHTFNLYPHQLS